MMVLRLGEIDRPISRSPNLITSTGCAEAGPSRNSPAFCRPDMKPMA
jgi:hypothetical protein